MSNFDRSNTPRETVNYKYVFTEDEMREIGQELAMAQVDKVQLEEEKKSVVGDYKAKIDNKQSHITVLSNKLINKFENRPVYAFKVKDHILKIWRYIHPETGEEIKREDWSTKDYQLDAFEQQEQARNSNNVDADDRFSDNAGSPNAQPKDDFLGADAVTITGTKADGTTETIVGERNESGTMVFGIGGDNIEQYNDKGEVVGNLTFGKEAPSPNRHNVRKGGKFAKKAANDEDEGKVIREIDTPNNQIAEKGFAFENEDSSHDRLPFE